MIAREILLALSLSATAQNDPWVSPDKALHFSLSAAIAGGGYGVAAALEQDRPLRFVIGGAAGLGAGIAKEIFDATGNGTPSWRDLTWDILGVTTGLLVAFAIDAIVTDEPPYVRTSTQSG